jgi:hypothetical protein
LRILYLGQILSMKRKTEFNILDSANKNALDCVGIDDFNKILSIPLHDQQTADKRRQPPVSIANKSKIIGDLIESCVASEHFECLR